MIIFLECHEIQEIKMETPAKTWVELIHYSDVVWTLTSFSSSSSEKDWGLVWQYAKDRPAACPVLK